MLPFIGVRLILRCFHRGLLIKILRDFRLLADHSLVLVRDHNLLAAVVSGSESYRWPCLCLAGFANAVPECKSRCRSLPQTSACPAVHSFATNDILEGATVGECEDDEIKPEEEELQTGEIISHSTTS